MSQQLRNHFEEIIELSDREFEYILSHFSSKRFRKHQFLIQAGNKVDSEFFVVEGLLKSYLINEEGKEHIVTFAPENWWVSDFQAYFSQAKASLNVDCIEDCWVLELSLENRNKLCSEFHSIEHFFRIKANLGYAALQRRILSLLEKDAKERFEQFSMLYPKLMQRLPKTTLASYLGVSRETLSRIS